MRSHTDPELGEVLVGYAHNHQTLSDKYVIVQKINMINCNPHKKTESVCIMPTP